MKLGLIGYPIGHSLSPWIHRRLMAHADINGSYNLYEIHPDTFSDQLAELKQEGLTGFNVTVPYKEKIIPFLDGMDSEAAAIGAVNTVRNENGQWIGSNTDGTGFVQSLQIAYPDIFQSDCSVLLIGAGGAAKGIYFALANGGITEIDIANRSRDKAEGIVDIGPSHVRSRILSLTEAEEHINSYQLVVHTTVVGMNPHHENQIFAPTRLASNTVVSDIVYRPLETRFLQEAKQKGARIHYGHEMLLHQAIYSFYTWTGHKLDGRTLSQELEQYLKGETSC
ncbi:shikimate dehydrogenase [Thalassobacillus sp. CUG 92003]|uniref:shikimate dehydrogenase n=1 Tax=Thalassobacillus sp. CUG 92003 TaxID=2736641 RepID=UPI0015E757D5|nr:shikimate dehydrogenase [Thalassobacillus sp. CUG 92003]